MKTKELLNFLQENKNKELLFEYKENRYAGANYHLTEVKNVTFETVDCGGKANDWKETHIQLWESPSEVGKEYYITTDKALSILNRVDSIRPLWLETEVKVEFGNADFHISVLSIENTVLKNDKVIVKLFADETGCKAPDLCGVPEKELQVSTESCCNPKSGCC